MTIARFQVGQKAFIQRDGQILVVFRQNGWLDFPGGRIEDGETDLVQSLKREVREETGLEIEVGAPFATCLARANTAYIVAYRCLYVSGEVSLSEEHRGSQWVDAASYKDLEEDGSESFKMLRLFFED